MKEPVRFRQEYFSICYWWCSLAPVKPQLDQSDTEKFELEQGLACVMANIDGDQIS